MTKKTVIVLVSVASVGALATLLLDRAADACSSDEARAASASKAEEGHSCSLDPADRKRAVAEFTEFAKGKATGIDISVRVAFAGDKPTLYSFLTAAVAREAQCCPGLELELVETEAGYDATIRGDESSIAELKSIIGALDQAL